MKKFIPVLVSVLLFWSCTKKGSFPNSPQITLESVSSYQLHPADSLVILLGFKDGQADVLDSVFFRENLTTRYSGFLSKSIPSFPAKNDEQGDIVLTLNYLSDIGQPINPNGDPDTSAFSLYIKDMKGQFSDTVETPPIVIYPN
ncbi:MAG TPA: hypothetical protein VNE41_12795 [Chitinophagaceae bacterium]|nr:hypothetical protein [Chitinophagaceae bacterium]